jgi:hypothetical protein
VEFSVASANFLTSVAMTFAATASHSLRGRYDILQPPDDDPEAFQANLRDTAKWVLSDLEVESR